MQPAWKRSFAPFGWVLEPQPLALLPQNTQAELVEGADDQALCRRFADQLADPLAHLPGCLVGEGHRGDVFRPDAAALDQVGDLARDDAGFSGTGACQHQQWAVNVVNGHALLE